MKALKIIGIWVGLILFSSQSISQVVNIFPVNLVGSSDPIPGPGGFIMHPFTPSPLSGTYHGGTYYGATKEKWGYNITGLTPGTAYTLTIYYMMDVVQLTPLTNRRGDLSMLSGAPLSATIIPYVPPANWRIWYTIATTFTAVGTTDRIDVEADGLSDNSLWLFTDIAIDGGGLCEDLTVVASDTDICIGEAVTLTGTSATGGTVTWDGGVTNGVPYTPALPGTFTYNTSSTSPDDCDYDITITVHDLPTITGAVDDASICLGDLVTFNGGGGTSYVWDSGVTNGVPFEPLADGTFTYTVTGTDINGCENTASVDLVVSPIPAIDAGLDVDVCEGATVTLTGTGGGFGGGYVWDGGILDGVPFTPVATGTYTVTGTTADGCVNTDTVTLTYHLLPVIDAGADQSICLGETVTLTGTGGVVYAWDGGVLDGVAFSPLATADYTLTGTSAEGCINIDVVTVTVNPAPIINAGLDQSICAGESVTLSGSGGLSYVWDLGVVDGVAFSPLATATYEVTGDDAGGCESTDLVTVTVLPAPPVNAGGDVEICLGGDVTLTAAGAGVGGSYVWDGGVFNGVPFSPVVSGIYTVIGTNADGCENEDEVTVTVNPAMAVTFTADELIGCAPFTVDFTSLFLGATYDWSFGDGSSSGAAAPSHTFVTPGEYDISLEMVSAEGCVGYANYVDFITVVAQPIASFSYSPNQVDVMDTEVEFTNESLHATSYSWDFGDGSALSNEVNPVHVFPVTPNIRYMVTLTAENDLGCVDMAQQIVGVKDVLLYYIPNTFTPDGDTFNETFSPIFYSGVDIFDYHFTVFNRWGEMIFESYNPATGWNGTYGDQGLVREGTYIWTIEYGETMSDKLHQETGHVTILK